MLDVHPPHHAASTWRDFFIHIATIVIGLLIAIGLEQTVEYFHHRHQLHRLEETLREEVERNRNIIEKDDEIFKTLIRTEQTNMVVLQRTLDTPGSVAFTYVPYDPSTEFATPTNAAWAVARDNGTSALLPVSSSSHLARFEFSFATVIETSHQVFDAEYRVLALVYLHPGSNVYTQAERESLLVALSNYIQATNHARMVIGKTRGTLSARFN